MYDHILIPTDGSRGAERGIEEGLALAADDGATVHLIYVVDESHVGHTPALGTGELDLERVELAAQELLEDVASRARSMGVETVRHVERGDPAAAIVAYVEDRDIDLVVMGKHGVRDGEGRHLGSTTQRVLRASRCPVMRI